MPDSREKRSTGWVMSPSGSRWNLLDPRPEDFKIEDIAFNLSNLCRFNGAVLYSVAQHSINVSRALTYLWDRPDLARQGLLHDATEAVVGDLVSPLKALLPEFSRIEERVWKAIAAKFKVPEDLDPLVQQVDREMAALEGYIFFDHKAQPRDRWWADTTFGPDKIHLDLSYMLNYTGGGNLEFGYHSPCVFSTLFLNWYRSLPAYD